MEMRGKRFIAVAGFWIGLALLVLVLKWTEAALPIGGDQGIYSYFGHAMLEGKVPYRDLWELKPPGVFYLRAAVFGLVSSDWVAPCLPGPLRVSCPWLAIQLVDYVYTLIFAVVLCLTGRMAGFPRPAALLAALLGATFLSLTRVSQEGFTPEKLLVLPSTLAVLFAVVGANRSSGWWIASGLCAAAAIVMKQTAATVLIPIVLVALGAALPTRHSRARSLSLLTLGVLAPLVLTAAVLLAQGALAPAIESTITLNLQRFTVSSSDYGFGGADALANAVRNARDYFRDGMAPFWLMALVGLLAALRWRGGLMAVIAVWALSDTLLLFGLRQYLQATPSYALLGGWALHRLWTAAGRSPYFGLSNELAARTLLVTWLGSIVVLTSGYQFSLLMKVVNERGVRDFVRSSDEWVADAVRRLPDGPMYAWGGHVAQLYLLTDREPAARYLNEVPFLPGWRDSRRAYATLLSELDRTRPTVFVVNGTRYWDSLEIESFPELMTRLRNDYEPIPPNSVYGPWRVYVRRSPPVS